LAIKFQGLLVYKISLAFSLNTQFKGKGQKVGSFLQECNYQIGDYATLARERPFIVVGGKGGNLVEMFWETVLLLSSRA
jgi:hypothetical protein